MGRYVEGEIGIGIGGNVPEFKNGTAHFTNVTLADNVLVEIGRAQPTNRTLSWGNYAADLLTVLRHSVKLPVVSRF